jgi:hypothetical protein
VRDTASQEGLKNPLRTLVAISSAMSFSAHRRYMDVDPRSGSWLQAYSSGKAAVTELVTHPCSLLKSAKTEA